MPAITQDKLLNGARERINDLFGSVPFVSDIDIREETRQGAGPDFVVEVSGGGKSHVLLVEARISGEPRLAREATNSLIVTKGQWSHACPVFVAPYISKEAAQICTSRDIGYLDLAGNCHISFGSLFIHTEGFENPYKNRRGLKSLSRPKSGRIIRVLLNNPRRQWKTQELAREAGVSLGLVSNVRKILNDREWIDANSRKIVLTRPDALLEQWIATAAAGQTVSYYYAPLDFIGIENALIEYCRGNGMQCAFTGLSGAVHLASGIDYYRQVQAFVSGGPDDAEMRIPGFEEGAENANVAIIRTDDQGVFYGMRQVMASSRLQYCRPSEKTVKTIEEEIRIPMHIVSPIQIYFDLRSSFDGAGEEAEKLYRQVIETSW